MTARGQAPKVITKRFLDEKQGLANGQPGIEVDNSLFTFVISSLDERRFQTPYCANRTHVLVTHLSACRQGEPRGRMVSFCRRSIVP